MQRDRRAGGVPQAVPSDRSLLEIGPFCTPAFRAPVHRVAYMDAFTTEQLREQARGMAWADPALVPEIDFVWNGEKYRELIGREFDFVFSSHNIEHQPCLVTHLAEVASVMRGLAGSCWRSRTSGTASTTFCRS